MPSSTTVVLAVQLVWIAGAARAYALLRKQPAALFKRLLVLDDIVSVPSVLHACGFYDGGTLGSAWWLLNGSCAVSVCVCVCAPGGWL